MSTRRFYSHHQHPLAHRPRPPGVGGAGNGRFEAGRDATQRAMIHLTCITVVVLGLIAFSYFARSVVVPVLLAGVGSMVLDAPVRWLGQRHVPKYIGSALVLAMAVLAVTYCAYNLGRPAVDWAKAAPENLPVLKEKFKRVFGPVARLIDAAASVAPAGSSDGTSPKPQPVVIKDNHLAGSMFTWTGSLVGGVAETIVLLFMLLASGDLLVKKLLDAIPALREKRHGMQLNHEIRQSISRYMLVVGLINVTFGALVGLSLHLLGLPNAAMWGGVAACLNFIPYFGPIIGMLAVAMAGLLAFDTLGPGLLPAGAYLLLHLLEADLVTPFVLGRRYALNPVVIFVSLMFCAWLWGVIGALLAVPLLVAARLVCERIAALSPLGNVLAG